MSKAKLLHIGYPKCMSTALQRDFFAMHPEIMFLGWGLPGTEHGWADDHLATLCEVSIRYEKVFSYDELLATRIIKKHLQEFNENVEKKVLCLSSESFSFSMHFDIDSTIKAQRLKTLLGDNTKVLIVTRNQKDLFKSYYFECVRGGYKGHFDEFLDFNYHYFFHSILSDLNFFDLYTFYCNLFGKENIKVLPMESYIKNPDKTLSELSMFAGIDELELKLQKYNDSSDKKNLQAIRLLNEKFINNHGNTYFGWIDGEKLRTYWRDKLLIQESIHTKMNFDSRMLIYRCAKHTLRDFVDALEAEYSPSWEDRLNKLYEVGNEKLSRAIDIDLCELGYSCAR